MNCHLFLSCKTPFNWHSITKIVNAHKPKFITFCHYQDEDFNPIDNIVPSDMNSLFSEIRVEHINMKMGTKFTENKDLQKRMDIRLGATFSHILISKMVGGDLAIFCTNYKGNKLIRMDEQECVDIEPINPLEVLKMSGVSFSMNKVSNQWFEFEEFLPYITRGNGKINLISSKLIEMGELDRGTLKVKLTDSNGSTIEIDSRENDGFWLEDIVMRQLSMSNPHNEVYTNVTRNQKSVEKQIKSGLRRALSKLDGELPIIKEEITSFYSKEGIVILTDKLKEIIYNTNTEDFKNHVSDFVFDVIYKMGAKNEFDGIAVTDDGIITIEIKSTRPKIKQLEKLESFSKHLSPVRGNRKILVYNCLWNKIPNGKKKKKNLEKAQLRNNNSVILLPCEGIVSSLHPVNNRGVFEYPSQ